MEKASLQPWAKNLTEDTHKMGPAFREGRDRHMTEDGVPALIDKPLEPELMEENYFEDPEALHLCFRW